MDNVFFTLTKTIEVMKELEITLGEFTFTIFDFATFIFLVSVFISFVRGLLYE